MSTMEDELRAVLDGFAAQDAPPVERRAEVGLRIKHRRRVRATTALAVVFMMAIGGGAIALTNRPHAHPRPATTHPVDLTTAAPGYLSPYSAGDKLSASATITMPARTTVSLTFTPATWDFSIGESCLGSAKLWIDLQVNGHDFEGTQCDTDQDSGTATAGGFGDHQASWERLGVRLGQPSTLTATIGTKGKSSLGVVHATSEPGIASIGIYTPVAWSAYPFPPKPSRLGSPPEMQSADALPHQLATITGSGTTVVTRQITLPQKIEMNAATNAPGLISVYLNGVQFDEFDSWGWGTGDDDGSVSIGKGYLASLAVGETVTLKIVTQRFIAGGSWQVKLTGS
jgi:hypothetical protein